MKKTLLTSAILAGLFSATAQAATVYDADGSTLAVSGDIDVTAYFDDSVDGTATDASYASINIFGTTAVSDTTTAYAEFEIDTDGDGETFAIDELVVGLDSAYGDFSFGGVDSALGQVSDFTDIGNEFGGNQEVVEGEGATGFAYANTFNGLTVNLEYIASSDKDADSVGVSAAYSFDFGLDLGAGYVSLDESNEALIAVGYTIADFYVAASYGMGEKDSTTDFTTIEVAGQYSATDALTFTALLGLAEEEVGSTTSDTTDYYAIEAEYALASNVFTYVGFKADNLDSAEAAGTDQQVYASISYDF